MLNIALGAILYLTGAHFFSAPFAFGLAVTIGLIRDKDEQGSLAAQVLIGAAIPYVYMIFGGGKMKDSILKFLGELKPDVMQQYLMSIGATLGLFVSIGLGGIDKMIWALFALAIIDYGTGTLAAFKTGKWDSKVGFKGLLKKIAMFAVVLLANTVDTAMGTHMLRQMMICAYAINEAGSIIENIDLLGFGRLIPAAIRNGLARLKETSEKGEKIKF